MNLYKAILFFIAINLYSISYGQQIAEQDTINSQDNVDEHASCKKLLQILSDNVEYPEYEREAGIQGTVYVKFIVELDGSLSAISIKKSVSKGFDGEALRVINFLSKKGQWQPAKIKGKAVRSYYILPIRFHLEK